jgi:hypothetical protein
VDLDARAVRLVNASSPPIKSWGLAGLFEFLLLGTAFNITDEIAHKFYLVGFVRGFGIYAKSFFENGQKMQ